MGIGIHEFWLAVLAIAFFVLILSMVFTIITDLKGNIASLKISGYAIVLLAQVIFFSILFGGWPQTPLEKDLLQSLDWSSVKARGDQRLNFQIEAIFKDGRLLKIMPIKSEEKKNDPGLR